MSRFTFYEDREFVAWKRTTYLVEAETLEDAQRIFIERYNAGGIPTDDFACVGEEYLDEVMQAMQETGREEFINERGDTFNPNPTE